MLLFSFIINSLLVFICVMIHYECLYRFTQLIPRLKIRHRLIIPLSVLTAFVAHSLEVWVFALGYYWINGTRWGYLEGNHDGSLMDSVYFSFTTYSTLGFGDIEPHGALRYMTGIESLTGLLLITWTASFLYMEMTRYWTAR